MKTFGTFAGTRDNNFNLLRFIAASMVIISHSFRLAVGKGPPEPLAPWLGLTLGTIGVYIFFLVSGYLISMSYSVRHDLQAFCLARFLRIVPGLAVCTLLTAFVLGPYISSLRPGDYFHHLIVYKYPINNSLLLWRGFRTETLPGVFVSNPLPEVVNGSLWTLPIELRLYLVVAVVGVIGLLRRKKIASGLLAASLLTIYIICQHGVFEVSKWLMTACFLTGMLIYITRSKIPCNVYITVVMGIVAVAARGTASFPLVGICFLAYAVFWFSFAPAGWLRKFNLVGDYSYGLYIYGVPVQQTLATLIPGISPVRMFCLSFPITLTLAVISWHVVEKPALQWKEALGLWGTSLFKKTIVQQSLENPVEKVPVMHD